MRVGLKSRHAASGRGPGWFIVVVALAAGLAGWMLRGPQGDLVRRPAGYIAEQYKEEIKRLNPPPLPEMRLELPAESVAQLRAKRDEALEIGILYAEEGDFVGADIRWDQRKVPCNVRLKGDWPEHLEGEDWSFRVKVRGDEAVMGMRVFSLQHPRTRNYDLEWLYLEHLKAEGVLAPRYVFVHLVINDEDKGVYALEEHFSKELLEAQGRREGVIVRLDESDFWKRAAIDDVPGAWKLHPDDFRGETPAVYRPSVTDRSETLSAQRDASLSILNAFQSGEMKASEVFKVDELARFLAMSETWSAWHAVRWHNLRFYYDPLAAKLEPIGFDATVPYSAETSWVVLGEDWARQALADPKLAAKFIQELERISAPDYPGEIKDRLEQIRTELHPAMLYEEPSLTERAWEVFEAKQETNRRLLGQEALAAGWVTRKTPSELIAHLHSNVSLPVELVEIRSQGHPATCPDLPKFLPALNSKHSAEPIQVEVLEWSKPLTDLSLVCRLPGAQKTTEIPLVFLQDPIMEMRRIPTSKPGADAVARYGFPVQADGGIVIPAGDWPIDGDLHIGSIDQNVTVIAGARLFFDKDAVMFLDGNTVFKGTADKPVVLAPKENTWGGVFASNLKEVEWNHVHVEKTSGMRRGGWQPTGGVNFVAVDEVSLTDCVFEGSSAEDQLNAVHCEIMLERCRFANSDSDLLDGDFVEARVTDSSFKDCGGDALDFSGSSVYLDGVRISGARDKGISAGERTTLSAKGIIISGVRMGVVSKDLSAVTLESSSIAEATMGLAVYIKKREYGPASLRALDVSFANTASMYLAQRGSELWLEEKRIPGSDFDSATLYEHADD